MHYVSVILIGGFANRVFLILAAKTYAKNTNKSFVLIKKHIHTHAHEDTELTQQSLERVFGPFKFLEDQNTILWVNVSDPDQNAYLYKKIPQYTDKSVLFNGYFQSPKYLPPISLLAKPEKKHNTYFLHIRLGDYHKINLHNIPLKNYYNKAIIQIMEYDIRANFLIFSNENIKAQSYIKEYIKVPFDYTFSKSETAYDTLLEMASCTGGICANSTLSWMASYYMEPRHQIYMPYPWINSNKPYLEIYPDWATVIDLTK
jgi:hypothetical protein